MYEVDETIIWVGSIKWKLQEFVVEVELTDSVLRRSRFM